MSKMSEMHMELEEGRLLSEGFGLSVPASPPETAPAPPRTVETVTLEIRTLQRQAQQIMLGYAVEIGRRLEEVKAILPHGQWGEYLKNEVEYSQSTANNFMRIFREYGAAQQSLFGGTKSQAFANLTYTKALRLLAIPNEEEREQFIAEHDVEAMSNRELDKALKEREEALEAAAAAREEAKGLRREADQAKKAQEEAAARAQRLQDALSEANAAAQNAEAEHARLLQELEELRSRPIDVAVEVDAEAVEAARQAAVAEMAGKVEQAKADQEKADTARKTAEDALAAAQKELAELKAKEPEARELTAEEKDALTAGAVEKAQAAANERLRAMEKQLAQSAPDTVTFKVLFDGWQEAYGRMMDVLERIRTADSGKAEKLSAAVRTVAEGMRV